MQLAMVETFWEENTSKTPRSITILCSICILSYQIQTIFMKLLKLILPSCFLKNTGSAHKWLQTENQSSNNISREIRSFCLSFSSMLAHLAQREEDKAGRLHGCYLIQSAEDGVKADQTEWRVKQENTACPGEFKNASQMWALSKGQSPFRN